MFPPRSKTIAKTSFPSDEFFILTIEYLGISVPEAMILTLPYAGSL